MVKYMDETESDLLLKVDVYIGGKEEDLKLYIDRPVIYDESGNAILLTPQEARLRNLTYQTHVFADVLVEYTDSTNAVTKVSFPKVLIATLPIMLHSDPCILHKQAHPVLKELGECIYDQGGYFIIDGKEKAVVSQERIVTNRLFVQSVKDDDFSVKAAIKCAGDSGDSALLPKSVLFFVIKTDLPRNNTNPFDQSDETENTSDGVKGGEGPDSSRAKEKDIREEYRPYRGAILVSLPNVKGKMPLFHLFRALGVESDEDIIENILGPLDKVPSNMIDAIRPSVYQAQMERVFTQQEVIKILAPRTHFRGEDNVRHVLVNDVFPNMNLPEMFQSSFDDQRIPPRIYQELLKNKAKYLGQLVHEILKVRLNLQSPSDKDSYMYKRIDISGFLLAQLFQKAYMKFRKNVRDSVDNIYHYIAKNKGDVKSLIGQDNLHRVFNSMLITESIAKSFKGMWGLAGSDPDQAVVQDLSRISYIGFLSHLRRVNLPLDRTIKITGPHRLHAQQWGRLCPFETPDGASVGYLKNFALLNHVTFGSNPQSMYGCFKDLDVIELQRVPVSEVAGLSRTKVYLNGRLYGIHADPLKLTRALRLMRRNGLFNIFTSIHWNINTNEVRILTDNGRPCRPLMIVEKREMIFGASTTPAASTSPSWFDLIYGKYFTTVHADFLKENDRADLYYSSYYISPFSIGAYQSKSLDAILVELEKSQAAVEFLDADEEDTCLVATEPKDIGEYHTHCEIHPSTMFSVVTSNIPFANHNQAPRNIFHGAQSKQAIGIYATNFSKRFDTMAYIQHYPQKPIITTRNAQYTMSDRMPNGFNAIVAVASYTGYNQEDGVIINKTAIERGLFNITAYKSMFAREEGDMENGEVEYRFGNPLKLVEQNKKFTRKIPTDRYDYTLLNDEGIIEENASVPSGHAAAVIGMVKRTRKIVKKRHGIMTKDEVVEEYDDASKKSDVHHYGKVDRVYLEKYDLSKNLRLCKVRFRKMRKPELGDKHSSRHGQKGVVGMIVPAEDMPFTKDGIIPDIIINPHAFPSRMTIGHLVECVFAKLCCMEGMLGDGTVFLPFDIENVASALEKHKFEKYGNEIMYNGRTGEQIPTEILISPTFYLRLKHMVADKVHARGVGFNAPHDQLTRQPTSGRSKGGGLRIGEMERDVLLSYGFSQFAKESTMERSDKYRFQVCRRCGTATVQNRKKNLSYCTDCGDNDISSIETPYAFKLFVQEMEGMGVQIRFSTESVAEEPDDTLDNELEVIDEENPSQLEEMDGGSRAGDEQFGMGRPGDNFGEDDEEGDEEDEGEEDGGEQEGDDDEHGEEYVEGEEGGYSEDGEEDDFENAATKTVSFDSNIASGSKNQLFEGENEDGEDDEEGEEDDDEEEAPTPAPSSDPPSQSGGSDVKVIYL
jgi:DNA-directed RNA polymerase II subunit RPB2